MVDATTLFSPIASDLDAVQEHLLASANGYHPRLGEAIRYVFETKGKRLRPALVLFSGSLGQYDRDRLILLAASLEVVHTASLVHDDTLDGALERRGLTTVSAMWDKHTAIVTGDYLFARSAELASRMNDIRIMHMLSETVMRMCSGEIHQYSSKNNWRIEESDYLERIASKTASLFAMCCAGAAVATHQSDDRVAALREYGSNLGVAFQIIDDVLDFEADGHTLGKPAGNDLREGTITLPAILFRNRLDADGPLRERLEHSEDPGLAIDLIRESGVLQEARAKATSAANSAIACLDSFASSPARDAMIGIAHGMSSRQR